MQSTIAAVALLAVGAVGVVGAAGCGDRSSTGVRDQQSAPAASPSSSIPSMAPAATSRDRELAAALVAFARAPSEDTLGAVPLAPEVALGLADVLEPARHRADLADQRAWSIKAPKGFRGYVGPFNAIEHLAWHAEGVDLTAFEVHSGAHPHCAGPPVPAPAGLEAHRRVSIQPAEHTIDGCLEWFTVDLFVDDEEQVEAITFDTWEP